MRFLGGASINQFKIPWKLRNIRLLDGGRDDTKLMCHLPYKSINGLLNTSDSGYLSDLGYLSAISHICCLF